MANYSIETRDVEYKIQQIGLVQPTVVFDGMCVGVEHERPALFTTSPPAGIIPSTPPARGQRENEYTTHQASTGILSLGQLKLDADEARQAKRVCSAKLRAMHRSTQRKFESVAHETASCRFL